MPLYCRYTYVFIKWFKVCEFIFMIMEQYNIPNVITKIFEES